MKKKNFFMLALAACGIFAACSNEDFSADWESR